MGCAAAFGILSFGLVGCVSSSPQCLPAPLTASPITASQGGAIVVSSAQSSCRLEYEIGHTYLISLSANDTTAGPVTATVNSDGSFTQKISIPAAFPKGTAYVIVTGSTFDNCESGGSCAGYSTTITVE